MLGRKFFSTKTAHVCMYLCYVRSIITSEQIELEGPGWSSFELPTKPDRPGLSSWIRQV